MARQKPVLTEITGQSKPENHPEFLRALARGVLLSLHAQKILSDERLRQALEKLP